MARALRRAVTSVEDEALPPSQAWTPTPTPEARGAADRGACATSPARRSIELVGSLLLILFTALVVWQVLIVDVDLHQASNAARTAAASRRAAATREKAARNALSEAAARRRSKVEVEGEKARDGADPDLRPRARQPRTSDAKRDATVPN